MKRKTKIGIVVVGLLIISLSVGTAWFIQWDRTRRVEWWMEHHYPYGVIGLLPNENRYYESYEAWSQAGQEIPGIDGVLLWKYSQADSFYDRRLLAYAMGAIHTPELIQFIGEVTLSTGNDDLRLAVLEHALLPNRDMVQAQAILLEYVKHPDFSPQVRCNVMTFLVEVENEAAMAYGKEHGQELIDAGLADGLYWPNAEYLAEAFSVELPEDASAGDE